MTKEEKLDLLQDVFDVEAGVLEEGTELSSLDSWNSMTKLSLIVMLDEEFQKELLTSDIKKFKTIGDILDYMEA